MQIDINVKTYSTKQRILAFFMAFMIFTMTCPEILDGLGVGLIVHATDYDSHIQTGDTVACMSGTSNNYTYSGKMKTGDVTVFDYLTDREIEGASINLGPWGSGGYLDPYTAFNNAVSRTNATATNNSSSNITFIYKTYRKGVTDASIYLANSGNDNVWPGYPMEFDYERNAYVLTMNFNTLKSNLGGNAPTKFIINGHDAISGSSKTFQTETISTGTMVTGTSYKYSDYTEEPGTPGQVSFTLYNSYARVLKALNQYDHPMAHSSGSMEVINGNLNWHLVDGDWGGKNYYVRANIWDDSGNYNSAAQQMTPLEGDPWTGTISNLSSYDDNFYVNFKSQKYGKSDGDDWHLSIVTHNDGTLNSDTWAETDAFKIRKGYNYTFSNTYETGTADNTTCQYTNPLYLGMFYISNNASSYTQSAISSTYTIQNYNNFHWLTNMGLKNIGDLGDDPDGDDPDGTNHNGYPYRGSAAVQGLVKNILTKDGALDTATSKGKLRQPDNTELPYFSTDWAGNHSALMKYYNHDGDNNIAFPFYEVTTPLYSEGAVTANTNVQLKDSINEPAQSGDYAKYYQFSSKDSNLVFTKGSGSNEGYFRESGTQISSSAYPNSTVGFFPFDEDNHETTPGDSNTAHHEKNNLGFGMKWEIPFTLQPDGCVSVVDSSGNDRDPEDSKARVHTTFEFKGDDDLWVFIDGKLILDMGGDHFEAYGKIDFATGIATVDKAVQYTADNQNNLALSLVTQTDDPDNYNVPTLSANFKTQIAGYDREHNTYDSRPHVITIFYMERGMADSNLLIRYNYSTLNNFSKMKVQEITNFDNVNKGLLNATMKAAENDVFKYTVSNTGTVSSDVKTQSKVYPENADRTRTNQGISTVLTTAGTGDPTNSPYNYSPPGNSSTEGFVADTSYIWVDDFAGMNHSTQGTGKTTAASEDSDDDGGGSFFLMYGTKASTSVGTTDKESSAEFGKQFSRYSLMRVRQIGDDGDATTDDDELYLYKPVRDEDNDEDNDVPFVTTQGTSAPRLISDYYTQANPYIFSNLDTSAKNYLSGNNAQFAFRNNIHTNNYTLGSGTPDENEVVAVQMTEVFENTVKTGAISVTKNLDPADDVQDEFEFQIQFSNIFGTNVSMTSDYKDVAISGTSDGATTLTAAGKFKIKKGTTATISGIPVGTHYVISETSPTTNYQFKEVTSGSLTGDKTTELQGATVVNTRRLGSLTLSKNVTGSATTANVDFTVTLTAPIGVTLSNYTISKDNTALSPQPTSDSSFTVSVPVPGSVTLAGIPYGTAYTVTETSPEGVISAPTVSGGDNNDGTGTVNGSNDSVTITNTYSSTTEVTVTKTGKDGDQDLSGAEMELWYRESSPSTPTYSFSDPKIVPNEKNGVEVSKSANDIGVPGLQVNTTKITTYSKSDTYVNPAVPSSEDEDWILPRSDSDYIYFRDYNVGTTGYNDVASFGNTNGNRSWRYTFFAENSAGTHSQDQELGFNDNYWYAAEFYGKNKKTVKYAMWERFVDKYNDVNTVVWKIQPPDGYDQVRFILLNGDNWIRSTEKINFKLGEIYHKTSWGGVYSNGYYYDVPLNDEEHNLWAPAAGSIADNRNSAMDQPRKYEPTNQKVIFHCNSTNVWHNIHIEFFTTNNNGSTNQVSQDDVKYYSVNGQAFPGYMMEPYAYAGSDYRTSDGYLTYELTIPANATHFRITNGEPTDQDYGYYTAITPIRTATSNNGAYKNKKNYANYYCFGSGDYADKGAALSIWSNGPEGLPDLTYSSSDITSDYDYIYFDATSAGWNKVYAYFYGGGNLRDDNWQRACYSAWPGVAPVGTDYWSKDENNDSTANVHSNTYSIQTNGNTYNGKDTKIENDVTVSDKGTLSPEAVFTLSGHTIYKFRIPMGDRKNYSKVVFNDGLKAINGGHETGVIAYQSGYIYDKSGTPTKHYEKSSTVNYTGRTASAVINAGEENEATVTWTEYVYVKNTQNWDDLHITFYDNKGKQIYQKGCGYVMDYAGKLDGVEYYRMPIPADAATFSVNNGIGTTATPKCDITRLGSDAKSTATVSTADKFVYNFSGSTLTRLGVNVGQLQEHTTTTSESQTESTDNYTPPGTNHGVRKTGSADDTLNIRDDSPWNVAVGGATVTFYNANGGIVGSGVMMKTNADNDGKIWYTKKIPTNAKSFSVSYVTGTPKTTKTTATYPIYSSTADSNGNKTSTGDMFYKTVGTNQLSMLYAEPAVNKVDDENYVKRGDDLYLICDSSTAPTVTFYGGSKVIVSGITAKYINADESGKHWFKVSIPKGADNFSLGSNSEQYPIYELKTKYSPYQRDYTLGDMQYSVSGTTATPVYPVFKEDSEYTLTVGDTTISSRAGLIPVDESAVAAYANADAPTRAATTPANESPVLYETANTNVSYSWTEGSGEGTKLRLEKASWFTDAKVSFDGGSSYTSMTSEDSSNWVIDTIPSGATTVKFQLYASSSWQTTDTKTLPSDVSTTNYRYSVTYTQGCQYYDYITVYAKDKVDKLRIYMYKSSNTSQNTGWVDMKVNPPTGLTIVNDDITYSSSSNSSNVYRYEIPSGTNYDCAYVFNDNNDHLWCIHITGISNGGRGEVFKRYDTSSHGSCGTSHDNKTTQYYDYWKDTSVSYSSNSSSFTDTYTVNTPTVVSSVTPTVNYSAAYQVEDRYGYISSVSGTDDSSQLNNFIYVTVPDSISTPYIRFYDSSNAYIGTVASPPSGVTSSSNGILLNGAEMKLNNSAHNTLVSTGTGTKTYRVRLPKNAKSFKIYDGEDTSSAVNLYGSVPVRADNGQLPPNNYEGNTVALTNFHHAGSTFTVTKSDHTFTITNTAVRANTPVQSEMDDPLNPKTDSDFVFLTVPSGWSAPYAYFYGNKDGEYDFTQGNSTITWPGVRDSGSYTDSNNYTVYRFQIPKNGNGTYSYVMFNNGTYETGNITEAVQFTAGGNYTLTSTTKNYGSSVTAYDLSTGTKAPDTATVDYSSGNYIYIINNGTQDFTAGAKADSRTTLDEMHVTFFSDANGGTVVGTGSLDAATNAGYIPDKVGTTTESTGIWTALTTETGNNNVYRIQVPSGAKYFQINNGVGKGSGSENYSLRKSEIKELTVNGLYKFVDTGTDKNAFMLSTDPAPTDVASRQNPHYLLELTNKLPEGDIDLPDNGVVDIHLATIVTDKNGSQKYIKWLRPGADGTGVDTTYLKHTTDDIGPTANNGESNTGIKTVKVKKQGEYYWKEVVAPSGYSVNENTATFNTSNYSTPSIADTPNKKTGKLTLNKNLTSKKANNGVNEGEGVYFVFNITLIAPVGTDWNDLDPTPQLSFKTKTGDNAVAATPIKDVKSSESLTRVIRAAVPATGLTDFIIENIPSGTAYYVTEEPVCSLTVDNSNGDSVLTATVTLTAPSGTDWNDYKLTYSSGTPTESVSSNVLTITGISLNAHSKLDIGGIPSNTSYTIKNASADAVIKTGTLVSEYSSEPVAVSETMYRTVGNTTSQSAAGVDEIENTIPSYSDNAQNAVSYAVTNERIVGSLTLGNTDTGALGDSPEAEINNTKDADNNIIYTPFKYVVYLKNNSVDLRDYIAHATLTDADGYNADIKKINAVLTRASTVDAATYNNADAVHSIQYEVDLLANNGTKTLNNLPVGTEYTVWEIAADATRNQAACTTNIEVPVSLISSSEQTGSSTKPREDSITLADLHQTTVIHNDYRVPNGEVILTKTAKEKVGTTDIGDTLAGAQFKLLKVNANGTTDDTLRFAFTTANNTNKYTLGSGSYNQSGSWLTTGTDGKLHIFNLAKGDYYLEEQAAPNGYSHLDSNDLDENNVPQNKKIYFSVGANREVKEISAADEMEPAYIRLFEHIDEWRPNEWGNPTFVFKIKQTGYYKNDGTNDIQTIDNGKEILVALTVNDDGTVTTDDVLGSAYNGWYQESTDEQTTVNSQTVREYQGMYDIDSQGRIRVEPGTYSISRVPVSRYEFVADTWKLESDNTANIYTDRKHTEQDKMTGTESAMTGITIPKGETADIHYYDKVAYYDKFSQVKEAVNQFYTLDANKANKTIKGIRVEDYKVDTSPGNDKDTLNGDTLTTMNLQQSPRFKAYYIYADGSEEKITSATELAKFVISYEYDDTSRDDEHFGHQTTAADNDFQYNTETDVITVANYADRYKNGVYTLKATYDSKFSANFDIVFERS